MSGRILIADPDEKLLETYRDYFTSRGFEVSTVSDGRACLEALLRLQPQTLVLEPDMPGDWGTRLLDLMRRIPEVATIPVVILTRQDALRFEKPVRAVYTKPTPLADVTRCVSQLVATGQGSGGPSANSARSGPRKPSDCRSAMD